MTYRVMLNMYINDWVKNRISTVNPRSGKSLNTEEIAINPSAEKVIEALISKIGFSSISPEKWKKEWLTDVNNAEDKSYNVNMSLLDFIWVLHKEGVITVIEDKPIKPKNELEDVIDNTIEEKTETIIDIDKAPIQTQNVDQIPMVNERKMPIEKAKKEVKSDERRQMTLL